MYRNDREAYNAIVQKQVEESKKNIPLSVQTKMDSILD
jgi:hypothetical protein